MYTRAFIFALFTPLGLAAPMFPDPRPYIPSGLGPLPSLTGHGYTRLHRPKILERGLVNTEGEVITGPIPDEWKHTHGPMLPDTKAEERSMIGCDEGIACGGLIDIFKDITHALKCGTKKQPDEGKDENEKIEDEVKEELGDKKEIANRDLGDCKEWMWGC